LASDDEAIYAFTSAGHVARPDANQMTINMFAPATQPFVEARKTAEIENKGNSKPAETMRTSKHRINTIDRHFGDMAVFATQTTNNEFVKRTLLSSKSMTHEWQTIGLILLQNRAEFLFEGEY
jgi:hypothetical protein